MDVVRTRLGGLGRGAAPFPRRDAVRPLASPFPATSLPSPPIPPTLPLRSLPDAESRRPPPISPRLNAPRPQSSAKNLIQSSSSVAVSFCALRRAATLAANRADDALVDWLDADRCCCFHPSAPRSGSSVAGRSASRDDLLATARSRLGRAAPPTSAASALSDFATDPEPSSAASASVAFSVIAPSGLMALLRRLDLRCDAKRIGT